MSPRGIVIAYATALIALALTLGACGGEEETTTASPAPSAESPGGNVPPSLNTFPPEFVDCLSDQGIDLESVTDVSAVIHSPEGKRCFDELHGE